MKTLSFSVRPELAERLKVEAAAAGISINQHLRNVFEGRDFEGPPVLTILRDCLSREKGKNSWHAQRMAADLEEAIRLVETPRSNAKSPQKGFLERFFS